MPMVPEALVAMLTVRGSGPSIRSQWLAANELAVRIDATPKAIWRIRGCEPGRVVAYKPLLDGAIEQATHKPDFCAILQREEDYVLGERDLDWHRMQEGIALPIASLSKQPPGLHSLHLRRQAAQGVVRATAGLWSPELDDEEHLQHRPTIRRTADVFWAASDVGWVVGHSIFAMRRSSTATPPLCLRASPLAHPTQARFGA